MKIQDDTSCCPLCSGDDVAPFFADKQRDYRRCNTCRLVFVPPKYWLSVEEEKAIYDMHQNDAQDTGYRQFLSRLSMPLLEKFDSPRKGLDFGCGPGPALSNLFEERGHSMDLYDPFYYNHPDVFDKKYDFVCATEVVEHLRDPHQQWPVLFRMLKKSGWLGVMTKLVRDKPAFVNWHYIRDRTHICFYSRSTFQYLAESFDANLHFVDQDVVLLNLR